MFLTCCRSCDLNGRGSTVRLSSLERQFDALEQQRERLQSQLSQLTPPQLSFRVSDDSWTIPEVVHHLALTERTILTAASKPDVRRTGRRAKVMGRALLWSVLTFGVRVSVPHPQLSPRRDISLNDAHKEWEDAREHLKRFLEALPRNRLQEMAFRHPIAGPIRYSGLLGFLGRHCAHHLRQIERIQSHPVFPR
jgi:hypothetical protein